MQYNFDTITSELRTALNQHNVPNVETICRDYERQLTQRWDALGIAPDTFNALFRKQQSQTVGQQSNR